MQAYIIYDSDQAIDPYRIDGSFSFNRSRRRAGEKQAICKLNNRDARENRPISGNDGD